MNMEISLERFVFFLFEMKVRFISFVFYNVTHLTKLVCVMLVVFGSTEEVSALYEAIVSVKMQNTGSEMDIIVRTNLELDKKLSDFRKELAKADEKAKMDHMNKRGLLYLLALIFLCAYLNEPTPPSNLGR